MILVDSEILKEKEDGNIVIKPFESHLLGSNSYDVRLGNVLKVYKNCVSIDEDGVLWPTSHALDAKNIKEEPILEIEIPEDGYVLEPGIMYLASTLEYTETLKHVPYLDGKSSTGRMSLRIHQTAGRGDIGFKGHWTMELDVTHRVRIYAGMKVGQLTYHEKKGECNVPYDKKLDAKYSNQGSMPVASQMDDQFTKKTFPNFDEIYSFRYGTEPEGELSFAAHGWNDTTWSQQELINRGFTEEAIQTIPYRES